MDIVSIAAKHFTFSPMEERENAVAFFLSSMNQYSKQYLMLKQQNLEAVLQKRKKVVQVASEMGVSRQSVSQWLSRYKRFGA